MKEGGGTDTQHIVDMTLDEHIIQDQFQSQNIIHILHVDDESSILEFTKQFLEMNDPSLVVESAGSAEEALKILKEKQFDCIVSDFQMPGMDGIEFAIIVKERNGTPVIIYTGRGSEEVAEAAFAAGVDDYLKKELDPSHYRVLDKRIRIAVEKHRAEKALKESEERFRGIAERSFDGIFILDLEGRITYISPAAGRNIGYAPKELVGRYIQEFIPETDFQRLAKKFKQLMEGTYLKGIHMKLFNKEGAPLLFEVNASPIIKDGKIVGIQGIGRDITNQKKSEEALRRSEEQARSLLEFNEKIIDTAIAWIDLLDKDGNVTLWNRAAELISGYSREEVIGHKKIWEWLYPDPDYRAEIFDQAINIIEGERTENVETIIRCKDGTLKTILWCDNSVLGQNGESVGSIAIGIDITEQKMAEEALRESEEKFRDLAEQLPNMVFINKNGRVVFANEKCEEIMGYKREEFYSPDFDFLTTIAPESLDIAKRNFIKHKKGEEVDPYEYTIITKEGKRIPAILTSKLIRYEGETAILGIITDVTARLQARANIKQYNDQLEALHRHATELGKATTLKEIAESTFNAIERVLGFNHGGFAIIENDILNFIHISGINTDRIVELPLDGPGITVRTVRTGQTQLIRDTREDEDFIPGLAEGIYEPLSELCVPIKIDGETVAVINIESEKTNAFQEEDQRLMEIFSEHVASAIRRIKEQAEQRRYEERLEALHRHATELGKAKSIKEVAMTTLNAIERVLGFDIGGFGVVERDLLRFIHILGVEPDMVFEMPLDGPGVTVRTVRTGETQRIPDIRKDEDYIARTGVELYTRRSELAVPVKVGGFVNAVINIESKKTNAFTEEDQRLVEIFAEHVASAIRKIREHAEQLKYEKRLKSLHVSTINLSKAKNLEEVYTTAFDAMDNALGFEVIDVIKVEDGILKDVSTKGPKREPLELQITGPGITARAARKGKIQFVQDVREDPDYFGGRTLKSLSELAVPVVENDETVVVLNVESRQTDAFTKQDKELMETLAMYTASAIKRLRQVDTLSKQEDRLTALHKSALSLTEATTIEEVAKATIDAMRSSLGFEVASYLKVEERHIFTFALEGAKMMELKLPLDGRGITVKAARTGKTMLIPDTSIDQDYVEGSIKALSELAVPVKVEGKVVAVLNVESTQTNAYDENDQRLLETLALHVASAIKNLKQREKILTSESQLRVEKDRLEILNEKLNVVGKLTRHDVRNKVAIIMSNLYLTKNMVKAREINEKLDEIQDGCEKISKILDFASTYEKLGSEELKPISVRACFNYAVGMFNLGEIELENSCGELTVHADSSLSRVFYNLIDNTLKHGGKVNKIRFYTEEEGLRIIYEDDGRGIHQEMKAKLFDEKSSEKGGHGLYLIRKIIESYGWTIREEGQPGKGAKFVINLPHK